MRRVAFALLCTLSLVAFGLFSSPATAGGLGIGYYGGGYGGYCHPRIVYSCCSGGGAFFAPGYAGHSDYYGYPYYSGYPSYRSYYYGRPYRPYRYYHPYYRRYSVSYFGRPYRHRFYRNYRRPYVHHSYSYRGYRPYHRVYMRHR